METLDFKFHDTTCTLEFRGFKTLLKGDSANGKTWLLEALAWWLASNNRPYLLYGTAGSKFEASLARITNDEFGSAVKKLDGGWVLIDRGDVFLNKGRVQIINGDLKNKYVIACRSVFGISLSPNHIATVVKDGATDTVSLQYQYNVRGW
jgi:hypothetical protein